MAMEKINGSPLVHQGILEQARQQSQVDERRKALAAEGGGGTPAPGLGGDTVEISETAHRLMALRQAVDAGRAALAGLPEIREERIAAVRERLQNGDYASDEVREKTAADLDRVLRSMEDL